MTPAELAAAVDAAGATIRIERGQPRLVGEVPAEVLAGIRANREEFLEAWEQEYKDRWGRSPRAEIPLRRAVPNWRSRTYSRLERYCRQQPAPVIRWLLSQGERYMRIRGFPEAGAAKCAIADLIDWQLARHEDPVFLLETLEESARDFMERTGV